MDKKNFHKDKMVSNVKEVLLKWKDIWTGSVAFNKAFNRLEEQHKVVNEHDQQQGSGKSTTAKKDQAIEKMVDATLIGSGNGMAYASSVNDNELKTQFNYTKTSLNRGIEKEICNNCMKVYTDLTKIKDKLIPDFTTEEEIEEIKVVIDICLELLDKPQGARRMSKSSKEKMEAAFAEITKILKEQLDKMMLKYKAKYPEFYIEYTNARKIGGWKKKKDDGENTDSTSDNNPIV